MQHANRNVDLSFLGNRLSNIPLQFISYVLICVLVSQWACMNADVGTII